VNNNFNKIVFKKYQNEQQNEGKNNNRRNRRIVVKKDIACNIIREFGTDPVPEPEGEIFEVNTNRFLRALFVKNLSLSDNEVVPINGFETSLCIGSVASAYNYDTLVKNNITHILTCGQNMRAKFPQFFSYKRVECVDLPDQDLMTYFEECFEFIDQAKSNNGKILIHCFAGRSRSATILTAYLMKREGLPLKDAIQLVKGSRPNVSPNAGFRMQLKKFQNELFGSEEENISIVEVKST